VGPSNQENDGLPNQENDGLSNQAIGGLLNQENVGAPHLDFEMGETTKASPVLAFAFLTVIPAANLLIPRGPTPPKPGDDTSPRSNEVDALKGRGFSHAVKPNKSKRL
jgi:hypothetical protein